MSINIFDLMDSYIYQTNLRIYSPPLPPGLPSALPPPPPPPAPIVFVSLLLIFVYILVVFYTYAYPFWKNV